MNERRERLLSQLDDPATAPEDLRAALDALDALDGPGLFDPQAGWEDLRRRRTKKFRGRLGRVPLAALIALVCFVTTAAAVTTLGLHEDLARYFGIDREQGALVEGAVETPACSVTKHGVTLSVVQTMADRYGVYVLCELVVPARITLPEDVTFLSAWLDPTLAEAPGGIQGGLGSQEVLARDDHRLLFLSYLLPSDPIQTGPISLTMSDLSYWDGQEKVVLAEGPWTLTWALTRVEPGRTLSPDTPIALDGLRAKVTELSLSPFSLHLYLDEAPLPDAPMALVFRDGRRLAIDPLDHTHVSAGAFLADEASGRQRYEFYYRFYDVIDPNDVTAVIIGEAVLPLS